MTITYKNALNNEVQSNSDSDFETSSSIFSRLSSPAASGYLPAHIEDEIKAMQDAADELKREQQESLKGFEDILRKADNNKRKRHSDQIKSVDIDLLATKEPKAKKSRQAAVKTSQAITRLYANGKQISRISPQATPPVQTSTAIKP